VTTRILCATNADLEERVAEKEFRKDLFYQYQRHQHPSAPAETDEPRRPADCRGPAPKEFNADLGRSIRRFADDAVDVLLVAHNWPGNVRELRNVIERAVIFTTWRSRARRADDLDG
jgi:two-component system, NtrC family, response regulator AtoC